MRAVIIFSVFSAVFPTSCDTSPAALCGRNVRLPVQPDNPLLARPLPACLAGAQDSRSPVNLILLPDKLAGD